MGGPVPRSPGARLPSRQLPLPLDLPAIPSPHLLPATSLVVLPRQVWGSLPLPVQAQTRGAFRQILQEVLGDRPQR
jgi:hypothetical protein